MSKLPSTGDRRLDSLRDRAASKIIWGEDEDSVYRFLRKEGISSEMADQFIEAGLRERASRIRQKSLIRMFVGLVVALISGGLLIGMVFTNGEGEIGDNPKAARNMGRAIILLLGLALLSGGYALKHAWTVVSGRSLGSAMEDGT